MHITLETDYAVRIVDCLARDGGRVGANAISERTHVTLRFSLKILRKLVAGGIVRSYKGAQGGYELAQTPDNISMGDIIHNVEGKYLLSRCLRDGHVCTHKDTTTCPYHKLYSEISAIVQEKFDSVSIAQMIAEDVDD